MNTGNSRFDQIYGDFGALTVGGDITPAWSPDGGSLAYVDGPADDRRGWLVDTATGEKSDLVDVAAVRDGVRAVTGAAPAGRGLPFDEVEFAAPGRITAQVGDHRVTVELETGAVTGTPLADPDAHTRRVYDLPLPGPARAYRRSVPGLDPQLAVETPSPDGRYWISTRDADIVRRSAYDGREVPWTTDGTPEHDWQFDPADPIPARAGWVAQEVNWSPDGSRLAAYRVDVRGVTRTPKIHYLKRADEVVFRHRAKAGGVQERKTLWLLDVHGAPPVEIDLGDTTDTYPVFAGWLPDGSRVLVVRVSRDCRRADVLLADATTGAVRELFSEAGDSFVRIHHDIHFDRRHGLWLTPDGDRIVWLSDRDGWKHLYLYDLEGRPVRRLTGGDWPVVRVVRCTADHVYFLAHHDPARPYDLHLCRVRLDAAGAGRDADGDSAAGAGRDADGDGAPRAAVERLTSGEGVHRVALSPDARVFVDTVSAPDRPPASVLRRADGGVLAELSRADITRLEDVGWTPPRQFTVTAADGETELWGVMFVPADFDPARSYPLVNYVYGGPQVAANEHDWYGGFFVRPARALAEFGYVTIVLDARGTPERSKAFHDAVYKNWAGARVADHATAIRQLAERHSFIDADRVGVMGHSWGGYTAFRLLADRPDVYRAAIVNAPGLDPYGSILYECYLGLPQTDPRAYAEADPYPLAERLDGGLLLACGTSDHQTWSDTVKLTEALIRAGKDHEFVVLPGQPHWYDATHDTYFWRKTAEFLAARLAPGRRR